MAYLSIAKSGRVPMFVRIDPGVLRLGRSPECEVVVDSIKASRLHAELSLRQGTMRLRDLGSTNGTLLRERRAKPRAGEAGSAWVKLLGAGPAGPAEAVVRVGDEFVVGDVVLRIIDAPPPAPTPTTPSQRGDTSNTTLALPPDSGVRILSGAEMLEALRRRATESGVAPPDDEEAPSGV